MLETDFAKKAELIQELSVSFDTFEMEPQVRSDFLSVTEELIAKGPRRPEGFRWRQPGGRYKVYRPTRLNLHFDHVREQLFFASWNHEILVAEILAIHLLRRACGVTDGLICKKSFAQILSVIKDELRHAQFYFGLLSERTLDSEAASRFFWRCSLPLLDKTASLFSTIALTFEQANLDFSLFLAQEFLSLGESEIARGFEEIYQDEIRHLKMGARHYKASAQVSASESFFESYLRDLPKSLNPSLAVGPLFDFDGRKRAQFLDQDVEGFRRFAKHRHNGEIQRVLIYNPFDELKGQTPSKAKLAMQTALETILCSVSRPRDAVKVSKAFSPEFLNRMFLYGLPVPDGIEDLSTCTDKEKVYWCNPSWPRTVFSKVECTRWIEDSDQREFLFVGDAKAVCDWLSGRMVDGKRFVVRSEFGFSGIGNRFVSGLSNLEGLDRDLKGRFVVEPMYNRILDFSVHFDITHDQKIKFKGVSRFEVDKKGQYKRAYLGDFYKGLDLVTRRFLASDEFKAQQDQIVKQVASELLIPAGVQGPVGIDGFLYRVETEEQEPEKPLIKARFPLEINPRFTFGRVALELQKRLGSGLKGRLEILNCKWSESFLREVESADHPLFPRVKKEKPGHFGPGVYVLTDHHNWTASHAIVLAVGEQAILQLLSV